MTYNDDILIINITDDNVVPNCDASDTDARILHLITVLQTSKKPQFRRNANNMKFVDCKGSLMGHPINTDVFN